MATIALGIDVDTADVTTADRAFDKFKVTVGGAASALDSVAGSSQRSDRGLRLVSDATKAIEQRAAAAAKQVQTLQQQLDRAFGIGAAPVRDRAADIAAYGAEMDALRAKFNPLFAASKQYEAALEEIARAEKLGAISANEAAMARQRAAAAMAPLATGTRALTANVVALGGGFTNMRGAVQNAAFQLQDIIVQMQMGGSASRALSMQLPQLLGGFGAVGAVVGLLAGVTIPLLASMMSDAGTEAKSLGDRTNDLIGSSRALISIHDELAQTNRELAESYGRNASEMRTVLELQAAIARADFAKQMREQVAALSEMFGVSQQISTVVNDVTGWSEMTLLIAKLADGVEVTKDEATAMVEALMALQSAQGIQQQAEAAQRLADTMAAAAGGAEKLEGRSAEAYRALLDVAQAGYETQSAIDASTGSANGLASATSGARSEAYSLRDAWSGVFSQVAAAQAAAARARIELETVGNPIRRAGRLAGAGFDSAVDGVKGAIISPTDLARLAKAREETVKWREEEAKLREEAAKISEFTSKIGSAIEAAKDPTEKVGRSAKGAAKAAKDLSDETKKAWENALDLEQKWNNVSASISGALGQMASGDLEGGGGSLIQSISKAMWGDEMQAAFEKAGDEITKAIRTASSSGAGGVFGLSEPAMAYAGTGIATAFVGAVNGNAQQIGSGIGGAIGGAVGSSLTAGMTGILGAVGGPIGMVLGSVAGSFLGGLFGGDDDNKWKEVAGRAFVGTTYESAVTTRGTVNTQTDQGFSPEGRFAFDGLVKLMASFNRELREYVEAAGGEVERGTKLVVNQNAVIKAIAGRTSNLPYKGEEGKRFAEQISTRVAEIMALAGTIAKKAGPELTNAQKLWRETQKRFSEENVAILRDLGFSARQIRDAQAGIRRDLVVGFQKELLDTVVDTGRATKSQIDQWKIYEIEALRERTQAAWKTARELGASTALVTASFRAQKAEIVEQWREMLDDMAGEVAATASRLQRFQFSGGIMEQFLAADAGSGASEGAINRFASLQKLILEEQRKQAVAEARRLGESVAWVNALYDRKIIEAETKRQDALYNLYTRGVADTIATLTEKLNGLDRERSDVLSELTRRAEEARNAEKTLADARKSLAVSDLAPGGPMDQFKALQSQFGSAIKAARGGDAGAASTAASLAQSLLQQGQQVFGSGAGYVDLFKSVNSQLAGAQSGLGSGAAKIEKQLDPMTFTQVTEKSTSALLKGLSALNTSIQRVEAQIAAQNRKLAAAEQKSRVA